MTGGSPFEPSTGMRFVVVHWCHLLFYIRKPLDELRKIGFVLQGSTITSFARLNNYKIVSAFCSISKIENRSVSQHSTAALVRSSLRSSGSTRRTASADRSGSCDGIVA